MELAQDLGLEFESLHEKENIFSGNLPLTHVRIKTGTNNIPTPIMVSIEVAEAELKY